jgi:putative membrane protein
MINSHGRTGPFKVIRLVLWYLRWDLLAMVIVAAIALPVPAIDTAIAALSILGVGASIFIGFRNSNAYNRWWEGRTLWGAVIFNCRAMHNGLSSVDDGTPAMAATLDRMRRRQVRHAWQLTAELRGIEPLPGVVELTPEDPSDTSATELLTRQASEVQKLVSDGHIDHQARVMLMSTNTGVVTAQSGLERIRNQPIPIHYTLFIRGLAWFFGVMAFIRLDSTHHKLNDIIIGFLLMMVFITAERLGHFIEQPMANKVFDLPMYRFCSTITGNLLGNGHPMAKPRESDTATVWM